MSDEPAPKKTNKKLGRGLSALLGDEEDDQAQLEKLRQTRTLPVDRMAPSPFQPRRRFDEDELQELSDSIRQQGLLQPILVRRDPDGESYQIVAGERRWRAAQMAQVHEVPVLIREFDDRTAMEISLVENVQRRDLTPLEEAEGYRKLSDEYGYQHDAIARAVGKSRSHITNMMRLLALPDDVRVLLDDGQISMGHARALLSAENASDIAREVVTRKLNVRDTEKLVQRQKDGGPDAAGGPSRTGTAAPPKGQEKDGDTHILELDLSERLGLQVSIDHNSDDLSGTVTIAYADLEQLDLIVDRLTTVPPGSLVPDSSEVPEFRPDNAFALDEESDLPDTISDPLAEWVPSLNKDDDLEQLEGDEDDETPADPALGHISLPTDGEDDTVEEDPFDDDPLAPKPQG